MLLCDRPHEKTIDFDTARFVVGTARGLKLSGQHLEMGDAVPQGALNATALRELYEPPLRSIELTDYAAKVPVLAAACTRRGVSLEPESVPEPVAEATMMCPKCGAFVFALNEHVHPKKVCKANQKNRG